MGTPILIYTPKNILLKAKILIKRVMKEKTDYVNKINLDLVILDL